MTADSTPRIFTLACHGFANRTADSTSRIFTTMPMRKQKSGRFTMRHSTLRVFTFGGMFPQPFPFGAVRSITFPVFVLASRCMEELAQAELLRGDHAELPMLDAVHVVARPLLYIRAERGRRSSGRGRRYGRLGSRLRGLTGPGAPLAQLCRSLSAESFALVSIPSRWHSALSLAISPAGAMVAFYRVRRDVCWFMAHAGTAPAPAEDLGSSSFSF